LYLGNIGKWSFFGRIQIKHLNLNRANVTCFLWKKRPKNYWNPTICWDLYLCFNRLLIIYSLRLHSYAIEKIGNDKTDVFIVIWLQTMRNHYMYIVILNFAPAYQQWCSDKHARESSIKKDMICCGQEFCLLGISWNWQKCAHSSKWKGAYFLPADLSKRTYVPFVKNICL